MAHTVKILSIAQATHNVRRIRFEKPAGFSYVPGHATDVSVNKPEWKDEKRPFTFTSLNSDAYLEFTIKCYTDHDGVTNQVGKLKEGDELIIDEPWGAIEYKGPGYFIAGGAGITPFIAILRQLHNDNKLKGNKLFFSNRTAADIIYKDELKSYLGDDAVFIVTDEKDSGYIDDYVNKDFLQKNIADFSKHFYVCGPDKMVQDLTQTLSGLGANTDAVVFEK